MSESKPKKEMNALTTSEIASFASSLGLPSSLPSSGFNDSDFRKPPKTQKRKNPKKEGDAIKPNPKEAKKQTPKDAAPAKQTVNPKPKADFLSIEDENSGFKAKRFEKLKALPKLPLVKASLLSSEWYNDAEELEEKVFSRKVAVGDVMGVVEVKREMGERLMWQYAEDFVASKGKSGDMKMVISAQKSGTVADKITAFEIMLGDPQNKSASNADFHLTNLLADHPNMKAVVIDEVDSFLFRPHLGLRAKYHAVNFLSQIRLSHKGEDPKVAKRLIDVYFALFKVLTTEANKKPGTDDKAADKKNANSKDTKEDKAADSPVELDSRILSALLTGVNRAFPYVSTDEADDIIDSQTPVLFKLVHSKNFNVGVQSLMLLDKISSKNKIVSDRFYRALYSKLLLSSAMNSSKASSILAMKNDINIKRVAAFSKRILQVALQQPPQYACGCLFLLSEVLKSRPPLWNMVVQRESVVEEEDVEHFEDAKDEDDIDPIKEAEKEKNDVEEDKITSKDDDDDDSSDGEEALAVRQSDEEEDDDASDDGEELFIKETPKETIEVSNDSGKKIQAPLKSSFLPGGYDPRHREPSYCNGDRVSWWELVVLASHAHPSVATMAGTLLSRTTIVYNGNPLNDLSLTAFLDKFMEKKPKQNTWHGGSQIEPSKKLDMSNQMIGSDILRLAEEDVSPEDLVFHKFYVNKMNSTKQSKKKKKKKLPEEEAAEELYDVNDGDGGGDYDSDVEFEAGDESDNEEIENLLDDVDDDAVEEEAGEYDYDDLDKVVGDDDELVDDASDAEMDDTEMDILDGEDVDEDGDDVDDDGGVVGGNKKKKEKGKRKSPFASLEEYEHLIDEDDSKSKRKETSEPKKKKKKKTTKASE
ncbi:hypothetical protein F2Q70_00045325 [Brassica cretica]|uniref:CCAAT-binding factor domain-containing protein n=1 Tax=Brassica cretica TaxID=69181 RepID=A0A8S9KJQ5_BRACR|nr:hypothetical protein F2Q70_00045325 [Brassica cretica]